MDSVWLMLSVPPSSRTSIVFRSTGSAAARPERRREAHSPILPWVEAHSTTSRTPSTGAEFRTASQSIEETIERGVAPNSQLACARKWCRPQRSGETKPPASPSETGRAVALEAINHAPIGSAVGELQDPIPVPELGTVIGYGVCERGPSTGRAIDGAWPIVGLRVIAGPSEPVPGEIDLDSKRCEVRWDAVKPVNDMPPLEHPPLPTNAPTSPAAGPRGS